MKYKQLNIVFFFSIFFNLYFATAQSQTKEENLHNTYAIVIGISGYQDAAIPKLSYADKDAMLFAVWLQTRAAGSVPQYNIKLLTNESATVAAFYNALDWAKLKAKKNDLVYIYFSGHGDVESKNNNSQGYLLAWNSPPNNYLNNAISVSDLNNIAEVITTRNKAKIILITDACHSGKMAGDYYKGRNLTAANLLRVLDNQVRMASCKEDEEAAEGLAWGGGRGVFSYYLLQGLQGAAEENNLVKLKNLQQYLDSCFAADAELKQSKHMQHPVSDGSLDFTLAKTDPASISLLASEANTKTPAVFSSTSGLQSLRSVGLQPIDYFFNLAAQSDFENALRFSDYLKDSSADLPQKIVGDYCIFLRKSIEIQDQVYLQDSLRNDSSFKINMAGYLKQSLTPNTITTLQENYESRRQEAFAQNQQLHIPLNHILILLAQLKNNNYSRERFADRFVQMVHNKSQDMINAYLKGDAAELEKRQYYATGNRDYRAFLPLMQIAILLAPENNYLKSILQVNELYLDGVIDRLNVSTNATAADSLLNSASLKIQGAMRQESYSAYIHNEMGNILFQKEMFDSALFHFNFATLLAPSWAIPYSNKIRVGLATNKISEALTAVHTADSLQPNLAFVNINAGLLMEKTGDLLAAESDYLRAIRANNVHYLPYERLGNIYLLTGDYALADSFLYDAKIRKELFAVNEAPFKYGAEMNIPKNFTEPYEFSCTDKYDTLFTSWKKYDDVKTAVLDLRSADSKEITSGKIKLTKLLQQSPDIPFAAHYLGKQKFEDEDEGDAEKLLKKAIANYRDYTGLKNYFTKTVISSLQNSRLKNINNEGSRAKEIKLIVESIDSSCRLHALLGLNYNGLEDHYILANIYHKKNRSAEEIKEYQIISVIENKNQDEQAALVGYYEPLKNDPENRKRFFHYLQQNGLNENQYHIKYFVPGTLGGAVKLERLLQEKREYVAAEKVLLAQVARNQQAGYMRQKKWNDNRLSYSERIELNNYWRDLNENIENETFHFYEKMIALFPRNAYWYKNAGVFLHDRLILSFEQINKADKKEYYIKSKALKYPFRLIMLGYNGFKPIPRIDYFADAEKISLPGTEEQMEFDRTPYEPVNKANYFLQQSIKFSGEKLPNPRLTAYIADLQSWMGLNDSAILNYKYALKSDPKNAKLITKLTDILDIEDRKPEIVQNFEILKEEGKLSKDQKFELTEYYMLQSKYDASLLLLKSLSANNANELEQKNLLQVKFYLIQNKFIEALPYVDTALLQPGLDDETKKNLQYSKVRIEAYQHKNEAALQTLDKVFTGYNDWFYLLKEDELLKDLRKEPGWKTFIQAHPFMDIYKDDKNPVPVGSPFVE